MAAALTVMVVVVMAWIYSTYIHTPCEEIVRVRCIGYLGIYQPVYTPTQGTCLNRELMYVGQAGRLGFGNYGVIP